MYIFIAILQIFSNPISAQDNVLIYEYDNDFDRVVIQLDTSNNTFKYNLYSCLSNEFTGKYKIKDNQLKLKTRFNRRKIFPYIINYSFSEDKTQLIRKTKRHTYVYYLQKEDKSKTLEQ